MLPTYLSDYSENVFVLADYFSDLIFYYNLSIDKYMPFHLTIQYPEIFFFHSDHSL